MATKKVKKRKKVPKVPEIINVRLGRLGDEVREFTFPKGTKVSEVLDRADIDGSAHTVKMDGRTATDDTVLNRSCSLITITELEGGGFNPLPNFLII